MVRRHLSCCAVPLANICQAEDNPANDYPDEELSSDDEFDRNPYRYHGGNESDEYEEDNDQY